MTAEAGLCEGPESILEVLEHLHVNRIGHGIRSVEEEKVVEILKKLNIPLEMCPTSNVRTGIVKSFVEHPVRKLKEKELYVTINSDYPAFFNCTLTGEYLELFRKLKFTIDDIKELIIQAVKASFLLEEDKKAMIILFETEMEFMCA